jgi:hypothetical protein
MVLQSPTFGRPVPGVRHRISDRFSDYTLCFTFNPPLCGVPKSYRRKIWRASIKKSTGAPALEQPKILIQKGKLKVIICALRLDLIWSGSSWEKADRLVLNRQYGTREMDPL